MYDPLPALQWRMLSWSLIPHTSNSLQTIAESGTKSLTLCSGAGRSMGVRRAGKRRVPVGAMVRVSSKGNLRGHGVFLAVTWPSP